MVKFRRINEDIGGALCLRFLGEMNSINNEMSGVLGSVAKGGKVRADRSRPLRTLGLGMKNRWRWP